MSAHDDQQEQELLPGLDELLHEWLPRQRWFAGKGRPMSGLRVAEVHELSDHVRHALVDVGYEDGAIEHYQVPVTQLPELDRDRGYARIAPPHADDDMGGPPFYYDALHEPEGTAAIFDLLQRSASVGTLSGTAATELEKHTGLPVGADQSNTSVVFGDAYILKAFRRLSPGLNPDLEITRALAEAGSPHVAEPVGWLEGELEGIPDDLRGVLAFLEERHGWLEARAHQRPRPVRRRRPARR